MRDREEDVYNKKKGMAEFHASTICTFCYWVIPFVLSYLITKYFIATIFGILDYERTFILYLFAFYILFELLLAQLFRENEVPERIANYLMEHFYRWL